MEKMTATAYKSYLSSKSKNFLLQELLILYKKFPDVKEFYSFRLSDSVEILEKYKKIIKKEFIFSESNRFPKTRFSVARKCLTDFKRVSTDELLNLELAMFYVECLTDFNSNFSPDDERFYDKIETLFNKILEKAKLIGSLDYFQLRAHKVMKTACEGYGLSEELADIYRLYYMND